MAKYKNYNPKFCQMLIDFFDVEPVRQVEIPHYKGAALAWTDIKILPNKLPSLTKFAKTLGMDVRRVYRWIDPDCGTYHEDFADAHEVACRLREDFLNDAAVAGTLNPATYKFMAVNMTSMKDKADVTHDAGATLAEMFAAADEEDEDAKE